MTVKSGRSWSAPAPSGGNPDNPDPSLPHGCALIVALPFVLALWALGLILWLLW